MYHIKDDPRSIKSARLMYEGLLACLEEKPLAKVSVTEVTKASGVGRATFYRSFDEVVDILAWRCDNEFASALHAFAEGDPDLERSDELLVYVLRHWMSRPKVLEALIAADRLDIIFRSFVRNAPFLVGYLESRGIDMTTDEREYFINVRAGFFIGIIRAWIARGKTQTSEEVAEIVAAQHEQVVRAGLLA